MKPHSGTLVIDISGSGKAEAYEGVYQCTAHNEHGTAVSNNIVVRQSRSPLWSKESNPPFVVQEGASLVLKCRPPAGLPPPVIFWMDNNFQRLSLSRRVSQGLNGDLYFSNVEVSDSRSDYICYARFPRTQTIQQKQPITVRVVNNGQTEERRPSFQVPSGPSSSMMVLRGQLLEMECIAEGLPTPEITWSKVSGELPSNRATYLNFHKTLRIAAVTEADSGQYRCTAKNTLGSIHHVITVTVKAAPYWIEAPQNLVLAPREKGQLICRASGNPKPSVSWFMDGLPIHNAPEDSRRKVEGDTIMFEDVVSGSSAVYQCNASNEHGYLLANAFVNVLSEPPRMLTPPNKVYQVIMNQRAALECYSFGSPIPKITWFKENHTNAALEGDPYIFYDNGTLVIPVAQATNSGKYTCVALNMLGKSDNHVHLEVKEPTRILKQPEYKVVQRNRDVVFECPVKHDPSLIPTMIWLKDNGELPDDERFVVDSDSLTITEVTESDAGTYTCIMNTTLDQDSASADLRVVGTPLQVPLWEQPDPPSDLELTDQKPRSVQLTWIPGDDHNSPIKRFLIQYEDSLHDHGSWHNLTEVPGTRTTAHLKLSPFVHYKFRVMALNDVGYSLPSPSSRHYKTRAAAPDENPTGVEGLGTQPDNLVIHWKPLTGLQSNGPGLQYVVYWRQKYVDEDWHSVKVANVSKFTVQGTPTFTPYEVKVQAVNEHGSGPEPPPVTAYSGEDLPKAAPHNVQVQVINSTLAHVHWEPVSLSSVRGHLKGYKVYYSRKGSLHNHSPHHSEQQVLTFSGNRTHGKLPGLHPFSRYALNVRVYNGRGEGPASSDEDFATQEGVPGHPAFLRVVNPSLDSLTLEWGPPHDRNGRLTGYTLKYQPVNNSNELGPLKEVTVAANETSFTLPNLKYSTRYKFYFNAKTQKGPGPTITQEAVTVIDEAMASRQVDIATQGWFIGLMCAIALLILVLLIVCFIKRNKGGKYPVKEKEDAHADPEIQPMKDEDCTFGEYSDNEDHKPLKGSRTPSNGTVKRDDSDDSLVDYGDGGDGQFNEDGSFIGQYSGRKERDTAECIESSEAPSPVNAMNSFV
ncbi:neuronal cell adhesion molecule-like isoform X6 [Alosa pseudoharengus]|uniref:neuronal cell adhesion molecule-like isoform X6 n=1 Tax=Alosa pseudoharengus TaxID=34774 RepID=UPI003F893789